MIALITPTGVRQEQFKLCSRWMHQQTYEEKVMWIIVDDGVAVTTDIVQPDFRDNWEIVKIYPKPSWNGISTQGRNIKAGIDYLTTDVKAIFIIEDDDYYKPVYLSEMMKRLGKYHLIGETNTIYYNVQWRQHCDNNNMQHSSLFQTAFTMDVIPLLQTCLNYKFIDAELWSRCQNKLLFHAGMLSCGIKGMPGRGGIGAGHERAMYFLQDQSFQYLPQIIGEDAQQYAGYHRYYNNTQHRLFSKRGI